MYRLIAFDLDQTLFGPDLLPSPRVRQAIARVQAQNERSSAGVLVTLVTGREAQFTTRYARLFDLAAPIVCLQGALVLDHRVERVLHDVRLPAELLPKIVAASEYYRWNLHWEMSDRLYLPAQSNHPPELFELLRVTQWSRLEDMLRDLPDVPHKFLVTLNDPQDRARVLGEMCAEFEGLLHIVPSHDYLIEGVPAGVDKGSGLSWLAAYLGIPQAEVMAVGDNDNDIPMLCWAGLGVAMGHASAGAKAAADWIAPSLAEDGAAAALERFVLDQ